MAGVNVFGACSTLFIRIAIVVVSLLFPILASAQIVILAPDNKTALEFASKLANNKQYPTPAINPPSYSDTDTIVSVGNTIHETVRPGAKITLAAHISYEIFQKIPVERRPKYAVFSDPDPKSVRVAIEEYFPSKRIGYIRSRGKESYIETLIQGGQRFDKYDLVDPSIFETLSRIYQTDQPDAFYVSENRDIYNRDTILFVLESLYRNRIPVISTNRALINKGSTLTIYTTPDLVATKTVELLSSIESGKPVPQENFPNSEVYMDKHLADKLKVVARTR